MKRTERKREKKTAQTKDREHKTGNSLHLCTYFGIRFDIVANESATIAVCNGCMDPF